MANGRGRPRKDQTVGSRIKVKDLQKTLTKDLSLYNEEVINRINKASEKAVKSLAQQTRDTAPVLTGDYASAIGSRLLLKKRSGDCTYVWYVRPWEHALTHLLTKSHVTPSGGQTREFTYLRDAMNKVLPEYEKDVEEAVKG